MGAMLEKMLRLGEAAKMIGVHYTTLYRWCDTGKVRYMRLPSGQRRIAESEVERILSAGYPPAQVVEVR